MKIVFMGTPDFAVPSLEALIDSEYDIVGVVTQPDRPKGRKKVLTPPPVKETALAHGLPVLQPQKLKGSDELKKLQSWAPDLIVTAAFGQLLPEEVLSLPHLGCMNVHASLLPKYRGGAPIHHAIINGERETGVTIMYMVKALDAGDIISQKSIPIEDEDDVASMFNKLSHLGAELLVDTLPALIEGRIQPTPQEPDLVSYAPNIQREDEQIDWTKSGKDIYNHIRGMRPFPGSFTTMEGDVVKVWVAEITNDKHLDPSPGTIYQLDADSLKVVCGDGTGLTLKEIQPAGKKRMSVSDFLHGSGNHWRVGMTFGG
ncbi:methionyl-tRNA formyltransferase [Caldalkalibacillus salinus]|uniref:methionyl-tRNA formyltransferase n=1 Tax=Caldalkalibacillus salinus TaxID=2803787 RepID=UPI001924680B|nr:methionyl-tRNA formyltransferase [Caldalkalibacillus salinus]